MSLLSGQWYRLKNRFVEFGTRVIGLAYAALRGYDPTPPWSFMGDSMRRVYFAILLVVATGLPGCSWYQVLFDVFGGSYTDSGTTETEKQWDYNSKIESYGGDPY
jgi:hypothetical protein